MTYRWRLAVRIGMVGVWAVIFWAFLYVPRLRYFFPQERSIAILAWPTDIDVKQVRAFEKETGIKVHLNYFADYEEFFVKLKTARGEGYDLVMPADYIVPSLINEGLLKKIDKKKLPFWGNLRKNLVGLYYDPENTYTVPYFWGVYGIGYNTDYFKESPPATWGLLFDPALMPSRIGMLDDARETVNVAAQYLFGKVENLAFEQEELVKCLLLEQKERVLVYTDMRASYLLISGSCPAVLTIGYEVARAMQKFPHIDFMIPEEGGFMLVDNFAIPAASNKDDLVYQFLSFVYRPKQISALVEKYLFYPPTDQVLPSPQLDLPTKEQLKKLDFFRDIASKRAINSIWIAVKA